MDWANLLLGVLNLALVSLGSRELCWAPALEAGPSTIIILEPTKASFFEAPTPTSSVASASASEMPLGALILSWFFSHSGFFALLLAVLLGAGLLRWKIQRALAEAAPPAGPEEPIPDPTDVPLPEAVDKDLADYKDSGEQTDISLKPDDPATVIVKPPVNPTPPKPQQLSLSIVETVPDQPPTEPVPAAASPGSDDECQDSEDPVEVPLPESGDNEPADYQDSGVQTSIAIVLLADLMKIFQVIDQGWVEVQARGNQAMNWANGNLRDRQWRDVTGPNILRGVLNRVNAAINNLDSDLDPALINRLHFATRMTIENGVNYILGEHNRFKSMGGKVQKTIERHNEDVQVLQAQIDDLRTQLAAAQAQAAPQHPPAHRYQQLPGQIPQAPRAMQQQGPMPPQARQQGMQQFQAQHPMHGQRAFPAPPAGQFRPQPPASFPHQGPHQPQGFGRPAPPPGGPVPQAPRAPAAAPLAPAAQQGQRPNANAAEFVPRRN